MKRDVFTFIIYLESLTGRLVDTLQLTTLLVHAVAQSGEALSYKSEGLGSIPDGFIGIFQ